MKTISPRNNENKQAESPLNCQRHDYRCLSTMHASEMSERCRDKIRYVFHRRQKKKTLIYLSLRSRPIKRSVKNLIERALFPFIRCCHFMDRRIRGPCYYTLVADSLATQYSIGASRPPGTVQLFKKNPDHPPAQSLLLSLSFNLFHK